MRRANDSSSTVLSVSAIVCPGEQDETAQSTNEIAEIGEDEVLGPGVLWLALDNLSARGPERREKKN